MKIYSKTEYWIMYSIGGFLWRLQVPIPSETKIMEHIHHVNTDHDALTIWKFDDSLDAQNIVTAIVKNLSSDVVVAKKNHELLLSPMAGQPEHYISLSGMLHILQEKHLISGVN